jgi:phenylalanyl-tRNA synthetase beta chain
MKIAYEHIAGSINPKPSLEDLSDKLFQLGHEHEIEGKIFNIEFTPNRGDCLSVDGILRDLSVFYQVESNDTVFDENIDSLSIDFINDAKDACPHLSFLMIKIDSNISPYHGSFANYFIDLDINKNNFFSDISNYISYETGQPIHCYDYSKINSPISLQKSNINSSFNTLLDKKVELSGENLLFFDANNNIINLAGVIGSKSTACSDKTDTVLVECAYFNPEDVIGKSVTYDIKSDAAHKFERGVDPMCHQKVLRKFISIVSDHTNIKELEIYTYSGKNITPRILPLNLEKINGILGTGINKKKYIDILTKLGFDINDDLISIPSHRSDINSQNDLAEEIARVIGYDNITPQSISIPDSSTDTAYNPENHIKGYLIDNGFYETINSPFVSTNNENSIKLDNPLDSNRNFLRTELKKSLLDNLLYNERRQKDSVKLFEISDIYHNNSKQPLRKLGIIGSGRVGKNYLDFNKQIDQNYLNSILHPLINFEDLHFELIPRDELDTKIKSQIFYSEIIINDNIFNLETEVKSSPPNKFVKYVQISDFPSSSRDLSFSLEDSSKFKELEELLFRHKGGLVKEIFIFDYFINKKLNILKVGVRIVFQGSNTTLTEKEISREINKIINNALIVDGVSIPGLN